MLCAFPVDLMGKKVGCGRCMPCRINNRRKWTARILLEARNHEQSTFTTLTYSPESVPRGTGEDSCPVDTLRPRDLQLWLKRFRRRHSVRFFAVGEYGDKTQRPHYHAMLFGVDAFTAQDICNETWDHGFTSNYELSDERASYITGYCAKKLNRSDIRLNGRYPEFSRMSLRPPIGATAIHELVELHQTRAGCAILADTGDVTRLVRLGGKVLPLDRTMRSRLRKALGVPEESFLRDPPLVPVPEPTEADYEAAARRHDKLYRQRSRGVL